MPSRENYMNAAYLFGQAVFSTLVVILNKYLFIEGFKYSTVLTWLHFVAGTGFVFLLAKLQWFTPKTLSIFKQGLPLAAFFTASIVFLNLSLRMNSVGFYQMMKILTTPMVVWLEYMLFGKKYLTEIYLSLVPVCIGVLIATVTDVQVNFGGFVVASLATSITAIHQIMCAKWQKDWGINSLQLLYYQFPVASVLLFFVMPMFDTMFGPSGFLEYQWTPYTFWLLIFSCSGAFVMNILFYIIVDKTSPLTFQVLGHGKTVALLALGIILFENVVRAWNLFGMFLAVVGMIGYSYYKLNPPSAAVVVSPIKFEDSKRLLETKGTEMSNVMVSSEDEKDKDG